MDEIALARHGESETAARGVVGGDTTLSRRGLDEARALGERLRHRAIDLCVTSNARRTVETAALALAGRDVPTLVDNDLGDIRFGSFEGKRLDEYRAWVERNPPDEAPPGGESRVETLRRFARAFRRLLERREPTVLVVAHGLTLRSVLDPKPRPVVADAPYGSCVFMCSGELERAVARLERWCDAPTW
jgi:broad specificity phosphatase PhoE